MRDNSVKELPLVDGFQLVMSLPVNDIHFVAAYVDGSADIYLGGDHFQAPEPFEMLRKRLPGEDFIFLPKERSEGDPCTGYFVRIKDIEGVEVLSEVQIENGVPCAVHLKDSEIVLGVFMNEKNLERVRQKTQGNPVLPMRATLQ